MYFNSIPKIDLPIFGTELEVSQIVIEPKVSKLEENRIINLLRKNNYILSFKTYVNYIFIKRD